MSLSSELRKGNKLLLCRQKAGLRFSITDQASVRPPIYRQFGGFQYLSVPARPTAEASVDLFRITRELDDPARRPGSESRKSRPPHRRYEVASLWRLRGHVPACQVGGHYEGDRTASSRSPHAPGATAGSDFGLF